MTIQDIKEFKSAINNFRLLKKYRKKVPRLRIS